jgi:hypothetical protein
MSESINRRAMLRAAAAGAAALMLPGGPAAAWASTDEQRLITWVAAIRRAGLAAGGAPLGPSVVRVGELARGTRYVAGTLDAYLRVHDAVRREPLTLSLTRFDCVTLVEACVAVSRVAREPGAASWSRFGSAVERMRYRGGHRGGYPSRLHYFSEWISDNAARGLVRDLGAELGGVEDIRPLRFMTEHRASYPALRAEQDFRQVAAQEQKLDGHARRVIPTERIPEVSDRIKTGDILGFATGIPGLDVTHSALAYRDGEGVLRVLHAPLSGGVVEITGKTLPEYVAAIRRATGILVARPLPA